MSMEDKNVKWGLFTYIVGGLVAAAITIASLFAWDTKGDLMEIKEAQRDLAKQVNDIDKRTAFLEGLTEREKTSFKSEVNNILSRMYEKK